MDVVVENVWYRHAGSTAHALRAASIRVSRGESVGIVGPNGAGKSTLLSCLLGFLRPARGNVLIDGGPPDALRARAATGYLTERPAFPASMSAAGVLAFHHALLGRPHRTRRQEVRQMLERVGLTHVAEHPPRRFSHGMSQRLGLACALLGDPSLLVLDEPATGLDPPGTMLLRDLLREARSRGVTVLLSSHQLDEVERACDRVMLLDRGTVQADLPMSALARLSRTVRLRVLDIDGTPAGADRLAEIAACFGQPVGIAEGGIVTLARVDDAACGAVVTAFVEAGLRVVEAVPAASRLEALFAKDGVA